MSANGAVRTPAAPRPVTPRLRVRQALAVARIEAGRSFRGRSAALLWLLALAPLSVFGVWALAANHITADGVSPARELQLSGEHAVVFAALFHTFILRVIVFFGCVVVFANLFRREIADQTLHYLLLAPVRREVVVMGKFGAGLAAAWLVFLPTVALSFALYYLPLGLTAAGGHVVADGATYVALTALACVGYGAAFLAIGLYVRNPILPALVILGWESLNVILPATLQRLSIIHYITQMSPVPVPNSPFAIPATPTPAWIAVPGLLLVAALALGLSALRVRRLEAAYGVD